MLLALLLLASSQRVAVLELRNKLDDKKALDATYLTDLTRSALLQAAPDLDVMTRESVLVLIQAQGKTLEECEGECEVDTARRLGADLVVSGELLKFGSAYRVSLRMHDVKTARLLSATQASGATADELANALPPAVAQLVGKKAVVSGPSQPWWRNIFLRNAASLTAGYGWHNAGVGPEYGARAFGLEVRIAPQQSTSQVRQGSTLTSDWQSFAVALSPVSFSTSNWGDQSAFELTYLEPFVGWISGTVHKSIDTATLTEDRSGLEFGTRAYATWQFSRNIGLRAGVQLACHTDSVTGWRSDDVPGATQQVASTYSPCDYSVIGGLALTLGR